ncbi:MAG TPA: xanthine dehydrogenase family protein molybdopterin-binding subunit [Stellaceae bacterium]|nr:xanthine dehydrogenase family protein molybdopterin-binding subunit [Stellaceae bacterium]
MGQFGIGQAVRRKEDVRFVTGKGTYTDDANRPGQAHAVFLRSPHAHARIKRIDTAAARAAHGILAVYTGEDVARAKLGMIRCVVPLKNRDGSNYANPGRPLLAQERVRHVGEAVAMVVAATLAEAKDAAELIEVDYEPLPAVTEPAAAVRPGAPLLFDAAPNNVAMDWELGDAKAVEAAFAAAARVVKLDLSISRSIVTPLEPRGAIGEFDKSSGRYTVEVGTQGVFTARSTIAKSLAVPEDKLRVVTRDVGGSFGMKGFDYPEHALVPWAASQLDRPVKWMSERQEAFVSDTQGREQQVHAELALDKDARFLAIRVENFANVGAYLSYFSLLIPTVAGLRLLTGAYRIPAAYAHVRAVFTNTVWVDAYRGAGRPETAYVLERLVDLAARETGLSVEEIRRRNFVPPEAMPYQTPMVVRYDSGNFPLNFDTALKGADRAGFAGRRAEAQKRGKLRGMGLAYYMEVTANMPQEKADIRFLPDGRVHMGIGTGPSGQGHETAFAQILEDRLGLPFDRIEFVFGDSDSLAQGGGTGGAKTLMLAGTALVDAAEKIIAKGKRLAGHFLEAAENDIEFRDGTFTIAGTDRSITIMELARRAREAKGLPEGVPPSLDEIGTSSADKNTFPNGCHVCEVEIDPDTGATEICRYTIADDFGRIVNPLIVEGQIMGGVVQGAAQALFEGARYDAASGQLLTGSLMDYAMPRAADYPSIAITFNEVPCTTNVLGIKGAGEAGSVGSIAATMNAVIDALAPAGVGHIDMPASPARIWAALAAAGTPGRAR